MISTLKGDADKGGSGLPKLWSLGLIKIGRFDNNKDDKAAQIRFLRFVTQDDLQCCSFKKPCLVPPVKLARDASYELNSDVKLPLFM